MLDWNMMFFYNGKTLVVLWSKYLLFCFPSLFLFNNILFLKLVGIGWESGCCGQWCNPGSHPIRAWRSTWRTKPQGQIAGCIHSATCELVQGRFITNLCYPHKFKEEWMTMYWIERVNTLEGLVDASTKCGCHNFMHVYFVYIWLYIYIAIYKC